MSEDAETFVDHYHVLGINVIDVNGTAEEIFADFEKNRTKFQNDTKSGNEGHRKLGDLSAFLPSMRDIRSAYRRLALRFHPDKLKRQKLTAYEISHAAARFDSISKSYSLLQDEKQRDAFNTEYLRRKREDWKRKEKAHSLRLMEKDLFKREREAQLALALKQGDGRSDRDSMLNWIQQQDRQTKRTIYEKYSGGKKSETEKHHVIGYSDDDDGIFYQDLFLHHEDEILASLEATH